MLSSKNTHIYYAVIGTCITVATFFAVASLAKSDEIQVPTLSTIPYNFGQEQNCLHPLFEIPNGDYIYQLCDGREECLNNQVQFEKYEDTLTLNIPPLFSWLQSHHTLKAENICSFKDSGLRVAMDMIDDNTLASPYRLMLQDTESEYFEVTEYRPDDVSPNSRDSLRYQDDMQFWQECRNHRYYPYNDLLVTQCPSYGMFGGETWVTNSIPHFAHYSSESNFRLVNENGKISPKFCQDGKCSSLDKKVSKAPNSLFRQCRKNRGVLKMVGEIPVCSDDKPQFVDIKGCRQNATEYDHIRDLLIVQCKNSPNTYALRQFSTCQSAKLPLGITNTNSITNLGCILAEEQERDEL